MSNNDFILNIIASLNKQLSKAQLKNDIKGIDNSLYVKVIAKLATSLSKKQLKNDLKQINNLYVQVGTKFKTDKNTKSKLLNEIAQLQKNVNELQLKVGVSKNAAADTIKSVASISRTVQQYADKTSITLDIDVRKEKAINDILYIGQKYSKLFSNVSTSQKYENLLNSAYSITDKSQLQEVRAKISAFTSELKANGLAAESAGDKWKKLINRSKELFSAATLIRVVFTQVRQAVSTTINLDKIYTDLVKVNDELNRNDYSKYLSKCNKEAQKLATTQQALIEGAAEFSKSGYDLSTSDALTEKSAILSNVGEMSASDSAKAIISGVQAYDVIDGYTDVVDKAQALIDKYNQIGNTASITTAEIAQGVQSVGSVFADANTSVDEFIALLSAGNRQYQDADSLALGLRTSALRIRGASVELEEAGEDIEGVMSVLDNQKAIKALTGVDILEEDQKTIRSIYDIYLDISKVYQDMSDVDQSALLDIIAGTHRASGISAVINNMSEAEEILQNSLSATGSAQKEYNTYLESTEAHIQRFQATLVETYSTFLNGNMISHAADMGTAVLNLVNQTDLLKHSILAVLALNVGKGITTVGAAIASTVKQMNTLGSVLQQVKNLPVDDVLKTKSLIEIGEATQNLTEKNLKLLLSQEKLKEQDRILILQQHNLTEEEAQAKLEKIGLTTATQAQATANVTEAATTGVLQGALVKLKASVVGLGTSMKATFLANPLTAILTIATTVFSIATSAISKHNQALEEARQKNIDAANSAAEEAQNLRELYSKYQRLAAIQDKTTSQEEEFKSAVENITTVLGDKAETLEGLTAGTDEYTAALKRATQAELENQYTTSVQGRKSAEEDLEKTVYSNLDGSQITIQMNTQMTGIESHMKALNAVREQLSAFEDEGTKGLEWEPIDFDKDKDNMENVIEYYNTLIEARKTLILEAQNTDDESLLDSDIYKDIDTTINSMTESVENYIDARYNELKLEYLWQNGIPSTIEDYNKMEESILRNSQAGETFQTTLKSMLAQDFSDIINDIDTVTDSFDNLAGNSAFDFSSYKDQVDDIQSSISTLRDALEKLNLGTLDKESVLDLMQEFPDLIPYIDLAADGFGNLSEGLSTLIEQQPDSLIQSLQTLKESLNTDEERAQVDALINSLQALSSYGDSGMEAYATAIGSTWEDTANVIEGVTTQFENLAKVQEAVSNGLTMSATAAAELAKIYPEILDKAQFSADGQITLNEDVVKSILAGDQSIINAQIEKLEADKAELTAKKELALAELEIANQVGTAKGQITEDELRLKIEAMNQELENEVEKDNQVSESYAQSVETMAENAENLDNYVGNVAVDMATNMINAAISMANSMKKNSENSQSSLSGLAKKASDVAVAIANAAKGIQTGNTDTIYVGKSGADSTGITKVKSVGNFSATTNDYINGKLSLDEFKSNLSFDISNYENAISNIDSQIEVLKNLQSTFDETINSANGGIGGHNYADNIKQLEAEKDRINNALDDAKSGASSTKDEFQELFDFFERRVKVLDNAISLLGSNLENVTGSFAKNQLIDAEVNLNAEKINNYTDALAMYTEKANQALASIPNDIAQKIQNGAVDLTTFIGDGNEEVVDAIKDYEQWADKVADCKQELAELKEEIRQLELEKFNNIIEDFTNQFNIRDDASTLIDKQIALLQEAGQMIGESFYSAQIDQSKKQLELLETEKARLVEQMGSAIGSGRVQKGTDEWLEMVDALSDVDGSILDCKKAIEEFDNALLELHTEIFDRIQEQFSNLDSELKNLGGLFDDFDVATEKGEWTKEGLAQLGLLTQQYELAQYQVKQYNDEIAELNAQYLAGRYSATEYADKLAELSSAQWDAVNASEAIKDSIIDLNETRINEEIEGIEKEIDAYKELIDAQIDALKTAKDLHDYEESIAEKTKSITDLERQIAAMQNDNTAVTIAKRKKLEEELANAKKDLEEAQYDHSIETQEDALNKEYDRFEKEKNDEIETLKASLEEREMLIAQSFENVKANASLIGQEIATIATQHGITVSNALISSWQNGENAIASYGSVLSAGTSAFIGNIIGVENEVWNLQTQANNTANSLAWMFSTRADTLVGELTSSYYAESNLNAMTNALQDSLVNTLERGYNISGITSALNGIANAANGVADSANKAAQALANMGTVKTPTTPSPAQKIPGKSQNEFYYVDENGKKTYIGSTGYTPKNGQIISKYASGTRNAKGGLSITDEEGYELKLPKLANGNYTITGDGDQVLTKAQTDNIFDWSKINPNDLIKVDVPNISNMIPVLPDIVPRNVGNNVTLHYDSLVTVNGDVNDTNHFLKQMESVAGNVVNKSFTQLNKQLKFGGS